MRRVRHNGERPGWKIVRVSGITVSTAGWSKVIMICHNGQHVRLEESEEGPA